MDTQQVIERLKTAKNRAEIGRVTGIKYMHLSRIAWGKVKSPGGLMVDKLRAYFEANPDDGLPQ